MAGAPNYHSCIYIASVTTNDIHSATCPELIIIIGSASAFVASFDLETSSPTQLANRLSTDVKYST